MPLRLTLFGPPTIERDGDALAMPFERRGQLVAYLALKGGWVPRAELAALLWPDQAAKLAYTNLRKALFRLQSLPGAPAVESNAASVRVDLPTDVADFERARAGGRVADALALRRGELLAGFDDDGNEAWSAWLRFERDRLRAQWRETALARLAEDMDADQAIELAARLLDADPLDEAALRAQLGWLARSGRSARARQVYREFAKRLEAELGLAPGIELKALHDGLLAGGTSVPPPVTPPVVAGDDGFVGRSVELRRIADLLGRGDVRLLNLVGPGGAGKTRLARRALDELAPGYPDAAFVALEDVDDAGEAPARIAQALGLKLRRNVAALDEVLARLRERRALLVLDNLEQLGGAAPLLERLLAECSTLTIIATSRVRLGLFAEQVLPLEGLPCPEAEDADRLEAFDAARLFVRAAQRVEPAFLPAAEADAIADICRQVEGLPLALELAAAWVRALSCEAICAELRAGVDLLRARDPAQRGRHAGIDVVFDHSWRLLAPAERSSLARLSVFRGGFTPEAARAVTGAALPVLGALADKSLVRKDGARLSLHPLLLELAAQHLPAGAERETALRAHADYFHRLLAQLEPAIGKGDRDALRALDAEFDNARRAWHESVARGDVAGLAASVTALVRYVDLRARQTEGLAILREALAGPRVVADAELRALLLSQVAHLAYRLDRYAEAEADATRAVDLARGARAGFAKTQALVVLASCALRQGRLADARDRYRQLLAMANSRDDPAARAAELDNLALVEKALGNFDEALRMSLEALALFRRIGDAAGQARCLSNLSMHYVARREHATAGAHLREALSLSERHGLVAVRCMALANLAEVSTNLGDLEAAAGYANKALEVAEASGDRGTEAHIRLQLVTLALHRGDLADARAELASSLTLASAMGRPLLKLLGVHFLGEVLAAQREPGCARLLMAFASAHPAMPAAEREELRERLAKIPGDGVPLPAWPGLELDELVQRGIVETPLAYAPLIARLRAAFQP